MKLFLDGSGYQNADMDESQMTIDANGFSCRQQINNGGFKKNRHTAETLYAAITIGQEFL
jgi:hypothetical protein